MKDGKGAMVKDFVLMAKGEGRGLSARLIDLIKLPEVARLMTEQRAVPVK